jgi:tetratricopeptide (TPR) repeat protein
VGATPRSSDALARLEDSRLVAERRTATRYRLLETVRQYARDLLVAAGESDQARVRHRDWYLAFAELAHPKMTGPDQAEWLEMLERDIDNLRAALDWSMDHEVDLAVRMGVAMQWLYVFRGHIVEGRERLTAIASLAKDAQDSKALAGLLHGAGNMEFRLDRLGEAKALYERALVIRERIADETGMSGSLGALGNVAQYEGHFAEAIALFERSLVINRRTGNKVWEATNLICLGNCARYTHDLAASIRHFEDSLLLNREIGNRSGEAYALDAIGSANLDLGKLAAARPCSSTRSRSSASSATSTRSR